MKTDEMIVRIISELDTEYGSKFNQQHTRAILEGILYDYDITTKETTLATIDNMQDMIMMFLATKKLEGLSDNTISAYGRHLGKLSMAIRKNVEDITTMDIRIHLADYSKTGVKNSTVATRTDIFKSFFSWLMEEEYITKNPMKKIKTIKSDSRLREPLTYEELEILRTGCKTPREKAILEMLYATSVRLSELVNMNITDINLSEMKVNVIGKGNKERTVYFNARAKIFLTKYLKTRNDDSPALFATLRKPVKRLENRGVQKEIKNIHRKSGLKVDVFPHKLRHTGASHMLDKGIGIEVVQEILGHEDINTTKIYAKSSKTNVENQYRKHMAN